MKILEENGIVPPFNEYFHSVYKSCPSNKGPSVVSINNLSPNDPITELNITEADVYKSSNLPCPL